MGRKNGIGLANREHWLRGQQPPAAKLTQEDVLGIAERLRVGETQASIAKAYGVHQTTISDIKTGLTWGWLSNRTWRRSRH
jgi:hypothetical protein